MQNYRTAGRDAQNGLIGWVMVNFPPLLYSTFKMMIKLLILLASYLTLQW